MFMPAAIISIVTANIMNDQVVGGRTNAGTIESLLSQVDLEGWRNSLHP